MKPSISDSPISSANITIANPSPRNPLWKGLIVLLLVGVVVVLNVISMSLRGRRALMADWESIRRERRRGVK